MLKVGVIGVGSMGQNHARLYAELDCELVGVSDANPEQGEKIARQYNTVCFADYHDLISKVDAVSIVVPTSLHYPIALDFLKAGVHCLVEKPISDNLDKAQEMIDTADANNVILAVGHIENQNPAVRKLRQIMNDGSLGQIIMISARRVGPFVPRIRDVGIIVDTATHDIGVINYLVGRTPSDIQSMVGTIRHEISDHGVILMDYDGIFASIEVNWYTPHKVRTLVVTGSDGIAYLDYIEQTIKVFSHDSEQNYLIEREEPLRLELQDFLDSIRESRKPVVTGKEAKDILEIALKVSNDRKR